MVTHGFIANSEKDLRYQISVLRKIIAVRRLVGLRELQVFHTKEYGIIYRILEKGSDLTGVVLNYPTAWPRYTFCGIWDSPMESGNYGAPQSLVDTIHSMILKGDYEIIALQYSDGSYPTKDKSDIDGLAMELSKVIEERDELKNQLDYAQQVIKALETSAVETREKYLDRAKADREMIRRLQESLVINKILDT